MPQKTWKSIGTLIVVGVVFSTIFQMAYRTMRMRWEEEKSFKPRKMEKWLNERIVLTNLGNMNYSALRERAYLPFGYREMLKPAWNGDPAFTPLVRYENADCPKLFEDWIKTNDRPLDHGPPPAKIPKVVIILQDIGPEVFVTHRGTQVHNSKKQDTLTFSMSAYQKFEGHLKAKRYDKLAQYYGYEARSLIYAMSKIRPSGKGLILGSHTPWVEAIALHFGASSLLTSEYQPIKNEHPKVSIIHPVELAKTWKKFAGFDFAAAFSSLEHSGLGRFGDVLDPWGDLREVEKAKCLLKPGGHFFLAMPVGRDELVWNAHRIYANIRLPMLAAGWEVAAVWGHTDTLPLRRLDIKTSPGTYVHVTIVLRKPL